MRIQYIGVGEAFDEHLPNCSVLVTAEGREGQKAVLLDCGFSAPFSYWRTAGAPMELDAVWISHFHGDHFFGLPALLLRFHEEGRTRPLAILGQQGVEKSVLDAMDLAYPGTRLKFPYALEFAEVPENTLFQFHGLDFRCALSGHSRTNYSLRLSDSRISILYSGDGRPTPDTLDLARGVDLVIHESFSLDMDTPGHGTVPGSIEFAVQAGAKRLALVHIRRDVRHGRREDILAAMRASGPVEVSLPEPGDEITL